MTIAVNDPILASIQAIIQEDVGGRGLQADPDSNLITATRGEFQATCRELASNPSLAVGIITGFLIPQARPPSAETDGPLGALFLARCLARGGARVVLAADTFCVPALAYALEACGLTKTQHLIELPVVNSRDSHAHEKYVKRFIDQAGSLTHLIALEKPGPSHTAASLLRQGQGCLPDIDQFERVVLPESRDRCYTMRGLDITDQVSPAHWLFEPPGSELGAWRTIGIGDGGNEIGMGRIPWAIIRANVPMGGLVACRIATDYLVVAGISNWGAYGVGTGFMHLKGIPVNDNEFGPQFESRLLKILVEKGGLVDGMSAQPTLAVDGLHFQEYITQLERIRAVVT
jgi:hypothetical protein